MNQAQDPDPLFGDYANTVNVACEREPALPIWEQQQKHQQQQHRNRHDPIDPGTGTVNVGKRLSIVNRRKAQKPSIWARIKKVSYSNNLIFRDIIVR